MTLGLFIFYFQCDKVLFVLFVLFFFSFSVANFNSSWSQQEGENSRALDEGLLLLEVDLPSQRIHRSTQEAFLTIKYLTEYQFIIKRNLSLREAGYAVNQCESLKVAQVLLILAGRCLCKT